MRKLDLTGQRFGKLIVTESAGKKGNYTLWRCKCDCGKETVVYTSNLTRGHTVSCGCFKFASRNKKHGLKRTRLYSIWSNIKTRCYSETSADYCRYGARGITMCDEWKNDFMIFRKWALDNGYDETAPRGQYTIDRINVNGNYEPSNCRWIGILEQQNNRRDNLIIEYKGEKKTLSQWCRELDVKYELARKRIQSYGWSAERAFTEPPRQFKKSNNMTIREVVK